MLFIQIVSLALGAWPTWSLARHAGLNKRLSFALALVYLLYPAVFNINLFDFHPEVMTLPAMLGAIFAARLDKTGWFCLAIIWVLGCKDALSLPVAAMGFWLFFFEKKRRCGAIALFIGSAWFIIVTQALIPAFNEGRGSGGLGRYTYLGESIGEIPKLMVIWSVIGFLGTCHLIKYRCVGLRFARALPTIGTLFFGKSLIVNCQLLMVNC